MTPEPEHGEHLEGVFPIVTTPFGPEGELDLASLGDVVEHVIRAGASGLVYPAIASEYQTLTRDEWQTATSHVVERVANRVPTVVGVSSAEGEDATYEFAGIAASLGAAATMWMPPVDLVEDTTGIARIASGIVQACPAPLILQNAPAPLGPALDTAAVASIVDEVSGIRYVKEETQPCGQRLSRLLELKPSGLIGVFGGAGGRFVLDELERGALGSMPACEFSDLHVSIFSLFRRGEVGASRALFRALLPLLNFESVFRTPATKEILFRMGKIACRRHRDHNPSLDGFDLDELTRILDELQAEATRLLGTTAISDIHQEAVR